MKQQELFERVTAGILGALETADPGAWRAPWHTRPGEAGISAPVNAATQRPYHGVNTVILWAEAVRRGYPLGLWATYKQWVGLDAQVRRGEKGTTVLLWKPYERTVQTEDGDEETRQVLLARSFTVFNVAQVDGYQLPAPPERNEECVVETAQRFFDAIGAKVRYGGNRAYYSPAGDYIGLPHPEAFTSAEAFHATQAHEHVHWTGHPDRCDRDLANRFGSEAYAAEELVAELGAAFLCAHLGLSNEPRADHAQYLASWLKVLRDDARAIVTASSKAQQATTWLIKRAGDRAQEVAA